MIEILPFNRNINSLLVLYAAYHACLYIEVKKMVRFLVKGKITFSAYNRIRLGIGRSNFIGVTMEQHQSKLLSPFQINVLL